MKLYHFVEFEENKSMHFLREKRLKGFTEMVLNHDQVCQIFVLRLYELFDWKLSFAFLSEGNVQIHPRLSRRADGLIDVIVDVFFLIILFLSHWTPDWSLAGGVDVLVVGDDGVVVVPETLVYLLLSLDLLFKLFLLLWKAVNL